LTDYKINKEFIRKAIQCGIPFATWSVPGEQVVEKVFCEPSELIKTYAPKNIDNHKGFVFAPFQVCKHLPIYIIPFGNNSGFRFSDCSNPRNPLTGNPNKYSHNLEVSKVEHIQRVKTFVDIFNNSDIQKTVLSRSKWIDTYSINMMPDLFEALNYNYINAFVYQVFIPDAGYWVGATPELLFSTINGRANTVSLAGTQKYTPDTPVVWDHKEQIEQELVTEHIRNVLSEFKLTNVVETGPETATAGQIVHIKTQIEFDIYTIKNRIGTFLEKLHPTPAVCGLPVKDAFDLILETEGYDREYYTGYLGPFNPENRISLYVNLRCLQAFDNGVVLYAGGGITAESEPEKEWEETRMKIQTLEKILETL